MKFSKEQQAILQHKQGTALVVAGPGTGKSTTVLELAMQLIKSECAKPEQLLVLTFSDNTVNDLKDGLKKRKAPATITVKTFHGFGYALIRKHFKLFGYSASPQWVASAAQSSAKERRSANQITYSDMIKRVVRISTKKPESFQRVIQAYQYIIVDELQDLDRHEVDFLLALAKSKNLTTLVMVGDRKQIIYDYRSDTSSQWDTIKRATNPRVLPLNTTYRLPPAALPLINAVGKDIAPDEAPLKPPKGKPAGLTPSFMRFAHFDEQTDFIEEQIQKLLQRGIHPNQIACLARRRMSLHRLQLAMETRGIPTRLVQREAVADSIAPVEALLALLQLIQALRKLGPHNRKAAEDKALRINRDLLESALQHLKFPKRYVTTMLDQVAQERLQGIRISTKSKKHALVRKLRAMIIASLQERFPEAAAAKLITAIRGFIKKSKNKNNLIRDMRRIKTDLMKTQNWNDCTFSEMRLPTKSADSQSIHLCTSHSAKGKEWEHVFVIDCVKGMYPDCKAKTTDQKEEELRVFYVTITRHSQSLHLLQAPVPTESYVKDSGKGARRTTTLKHTSPYIEQYKAYIDHVD